MATLEEYAATHSRDSRCLICKLPRQILIEAQDAFDTRRVKAPTIRKWLQDEHGLPEHVWDSSVRQHLQNHRSRWDV